MCSLPRRLASYIAMSAASRIPPTPSASLGPGAKAYEDPELFLRSAGQSFTNPLVEGPGPLGFGTGHEYHKLLATVAGHHVYKLRVFLQRPGHEPQGVVSQEGAVLAVDGLEVVEVGEEQREARA